MFLTLNVVIINKILQLKKYILFFIVVFAAGTVKAQSGYTYQQFGVGVDAGYVHGYTNLATQYSHPSYSISGVYSLTPYIPIAAELQFGQLSGGDSPYNVYNPAAPLDKYGRGYVNTYKAFYLHADYQLGNDIDYSYGTFLQIIKNFYVGTGIGFVSNNNQNQRTNLIPSNGSTSYVFPGKSTGVDPVLPLRVGYEFKIYNYYNVPSMALDLGYTQYIDFGSGLDGYSNPPPFKQKYLNQYGQFVVSLKFFFGEPVPYNKLIRPFNYNY